MKGALESFFFAKTRTIGEGTSDPNQSNKKTSFTTATKYKLRRRSVYHYLGDTLDSYFQSNVTISITYAMSYDET